MPLPFPIPAPDQLPALTIPQPLAWATVYGGRTTDSRDSYTDHRGPVAIHAAARAWDRMAQFDGRVRRAWRLHSLLGQFTHEPVSALYPEADQIMYGAVLGVADLIDCHPVTANCCPEWGDRLFNHLVLANVVPLPEPVPCPDRLDYQGLLWDLLPEVAALVVEQLRVEARLRAVEAGR